MKALIQRLVSDSVHGSILKLLALAARIAFLTLIIPGLPDGVLSGYVFANSVAVLGATALILGLDEELPRIIGGSLEKARTYLRWFFILSGLGAATLAALLVIPDNNLAIMAFMLAVIAGRLLAGIIRSIDPHIHERTQNLPWISFIAIVTALQLDRTLPLIATMAGSMLLFQYFGAWVVLRRASRGHQQQSVALLALIRLGLRHGLPRLASNFFLLGVVRGAILWPVWLGLSVRLDEIAFAIAVGEMLAQFGRIPANHAYARWCRKPPLARKDWNDAVITAVFLAVGLYLAASISLVVVGEFGWLPRQAQNIGLQLQALLLSATIPAFGMLRYLSWSRNLLGFWIAGLTLIMAIMTAVAIYLLDVHYWFYALAGILAAGIWMMALKMLPYFQGHPAQQ